MTKKEKIRIVLAFILFIGFTTGYYIGTTRSGELEEKPKSAYEIIQEGYERVGR